MQRNIFLFYQTMEIHEKIRTIRLSKGFTQDNIAEKLNIDPVNFGRIERGQANLTMERFLKICEILEVHPRLFFEDSTEEGESRTLLEKIYQEIKQINEKLDNKTV